MSIISARVWLFFFTLVSGLVVVNSIAYAENPWIDAGDYGSFSAAMSAAGENEKVILIAKRLNVTADATVPSNITLWFMPGGSLNIQRGVTVTILGSIDAGLNKIFIGDGTVKFNPDFYGLGNIGEVYSEWWGAKADGNTDCTEALQKAMDACGQTRVLRLVDGVYRISSVLKVRCSIRGNSPYNSIIQNTGTGDAVYIYAPYMQTWMNFCVKGNPTSRDGITLFDDESKGNLCYSSFQNVHAASNGRHGLYHRNAWATKYIECKFEGNGGLGIFLDTREGDPGTHNGVSFINCESRWNGGNDPNTTQDDDKGGVKVVGAAMVAFIGGVYESNNAWGFIISNQNYFSTRNVHIRNVYMEDHPHAANVGGHFYVSGNWENVTVEQSWLGYGAREGGMGYCFYIGSRAVDTAVFKERDNFAVACGHPSATKRSFGTTHDESRTLISEMFGDVQGAGKASKTNLLKVSGDGAWIVSGSVHVKSNGSSSGGVYPFIASRNSASGMAVTVGSPEVGSADKAPTMTFAGDELQISLAENQYAFVKAEEQIAAGHEPATFEWSSDLFGTMIRRR